MLAGASVVAAGSEPPTSGSVAADPAIDDDPAGAPTVDADGNAVLGSTTDVADGAVDDHYLVAVDGPAALSDVQADLAAEGVPITNTWTGDLSGLTAILDGPGAAALEAHDDVLAVEPDDPIEITATQTGAPWNLDRIDQRALPLDSTYSYTETGLGVTAYVIDTGLRRTHVEFGGRGDRGAYWDFGDGTGTLDCNGHGTHVAGTIGGTTWGVAKAVTIVPVKAFSCTGTSMESIVVESINWIIDDHPAGTPAVVNMSLGGAASGVLDAAVNRLIADGITVVAAAGNDGEPTCSSSPGRVPAAITVAATDQLDRRATFSNVGPCNDLFAPGVGIRSASYTSDTGSLLKSGTSMAAPHVTGDAALILQRHPAATPAEVWQMIAADATRGAMSACCGDPDVLLHVGPDSRRAVTSSAATTAAAFSAAGTTGRPPPRRRRPSGGVGGRRARRRVRTRARRRPLDPTPRRQRVEQLEQPRRHHHRGTGRRIGVARHHHRLRSRSGRRPLDPSLRRQRVERLEHARRHHHHCAQRRLALPRHARRVRRRGRPGALHAPLRRRRVEQLGQPRRHHHRGTGRRVGVVGHHHRLRSRSGRCAVGDLLRRCLGWLGHARRHHHDRAGRRLHAAAVSRSWRAARTTRCGPAPTRARGAAGRRWVVS